MLVGIAADHGGFTLKEQVSELLGVSGYEVKVQALENHKVEP